MSDLISRLSELRSQYSCFNDSEREAYHTLSEAIEALKEPKTGQMNKKEYTLPDGRTAVFWYDEDNLGKISLEAMDMLMSMITEKWIPCSERLPDVHEFVNTHGYSLSSDYMLISIRFGEHNTKHAVTIGRYMQGDPKWKWKLLHGNLYGIVDAWMPLPEPYQENAQLSTEDTTQIFADGMPLEEYLTREWEKQRAYLEEHGIIFRDGGAE